jgi:hypothetical protein
MDPNSSGWETIETIYDAARKRRVIIFRQPNGTYGYREEKFFTNALAEIDGWAVILRGNSSYDTIETALREVPDNVTWLPRQPDDHNR